MTIPMVSRWDVPGVMGWNYSYNNFGENTGRATYAQNLYDSTLDRSYQYDQVGRLVVAHSGAEARAHALNGQWGTQDGPFSQGYDYDAWGNPTSRSGWGGWNPAYASWGGETNCSSNQAFQPKKFTSYMRDAALHKSIGTDSALADD